MEKINFEDGVLITPAKVIIDGKEYEIIPATRQGNTPLSAHNLNRMQDNIESAVNENAEEIDKIDEKTRGISKTVNTTIQPGEYHQVAFSFICGFASFRVFASNYEQNKIYAMMVSNKFASKISEIEGYLFANNPDISVTFEIIDGANDDWNKYIRINNTGSVAVTLSYGVLNMI